jgi:hypothetical protein
MSTVPESPRREAQAPVAADWRRVHAFGLPDGSIRALLAVAIFATIWALLVKRPDREVPEYLRNLLFVIMGHYFATRRRVAHDVVQGPGPLFLPRGTIRWISFAGFVCVGLLLFRDGRFTDPIGTPGVVTLILVAGFLLGVVVARIGEWRAERGHPTPRWVEDLRAAAALVSAAILVFLVWRGIIDGTGAPLGDKPPAGVPFRVEQVLSAVVGFYFGSRS